MTRKDLKEHKSMSLGIELGSTRIKAVLLDEYNRTIAVGIHNWENKLIDNIWTYSEESIWHGIKSCYLNLKDHVHKQYGITLKKIDAIGISGMMHGYIALDSNDNLLVPFRTWRNTMTKEASEKLADLFSFPIPQRWSIAHLYQAILNEEEHVNNIASITTVAGYVHYKFTDNLVLGIGEASGVFPIDSFSKNYNQRMIEQFNGLLSDNIAWKLSDILPQVLIAGDYAGKLSREGALMLDPSGDLEPGIPFCPPEGDAGTGMIATNAIRPRKGNVSAGTSVFSMVVLEKPLSRPYDTIDIVTTPIGDDVAMVHVNNCTSDINAWVGFVEDVLRLFDYSVTKEELYSKLFNSTLVGESDTGNLLTYNYFSGEHITRFEEGRPVLVRKPNSSFSIANVMKANLFSAIAVLTIGMNVLLNEEQVRVDSITGHGGLFNIPVVGQRVLASAINTPVTTMRTASEGGPYGMAVLANYLLSRDQYKNLEEYLDEVVFANTATHTEQPDPQLKVDFEQYLKKYIKGLPIEKQAVESLE